MTPWLDIPPIEAPPRPFRGGAERLLMQDGAAALLRRELAAPSPLWTSLILVCSDLAVAMLVTAALCLIAAPAVAPAAWLFQPLVFAGWMGVLLGTFALAGLYELALVHPAAELKRLAAGLLALLTVVAAVYHLTVREPFTLAEVLFWTACGGATFGSVALSRATVRMLGAKARWWGYPVVIVGEGRAARRYVRTLHQWPDLGLRPLLLLDDTASPSFFEGVPVLPGAAYAPLVARHFGVRYGVVVLGDDDGAERLQKTAQWARSFKRILVVSGASVWPDLWSADHTSRGIPAYVVRHARDRWAGRIAKRGLDLVVTLLAILLLSPLFLVCSLLVKLGSPGPAFYRQARLGRNGRPFWVLKFRSMYVDAEEKLQEVLGESAALRSEYETFRKLRRDPRITPVGRFLRRYSIDELPQLLNVLFGEMSLVGPRAYAADEFDLMQGIDQTILQHPPRSEEHTSEHQTLRRI